MNFNKRKLWDENQINANLLNEGWRQKGCKKTLRMQSLFQTLCHEILQKATRYMRSNTKRTSKTRHSFPFTSSNHGEKTFQTMSNVIYAHIEKRPEGKDTLVKDLGKKSQFSHTLKLARIYDWKLAPTGATCSLKTSTNGQLARVANWKQAPTPENEKNKEFLPTKTRLTTSSKISKTQMNHVI